MKQLTEANRQKIKEYFTKKYDLKEGIIDYIFGKVLVNKLQNDKNFVDFAKELDRKMQGHKELLQWYADKNKPIPDSVTKAMLTGKY